MAVSVIGLLTIASRGTSFLTVALMLKVDIPADNSTGSTYSLLSDIDFISVICSSYDGCKKKQNSFLFS
jgi:hypothetical protein